MRISFCWQGLDGRYGQWNDGLRAAIRILAKTHEVRLFDFPLKGMDEFKPDIVLYWEAPCTINGKDRDNYRSVLELPYKKALLFAGGELRKEWVYQFDLLFVESQIDEDTCARLGIPSKRAFGVNTEIMKPQKQGKAFDACFQATCASWKRHWLLAEALHEKACIVGRFQESDPIGFIRAREHGAVVLPEVSAEGVAALLNASHTMVNCSDFWGGGQRATLEAMACGVQPIVMDDSPKNREYVEESGFGQVCAPDPNAIRDAVVTTGDYDRQKGIEYIQSKYTEGHYARALLDGISDIL